MLDGWPPIDEPELRRRLALDAGAFLETYAGFLAAVGPRRLREADYVRALGYPWARPPSSFRLDGDAVAPLEATPEAELAGRWPLLAIGSNGAPETLVRKLAHLPEPERRVLAEAGALHDFDVVAATFPTVYGSFAATLVPSPGTALRASVLWVTPAQLTALAWTETSYLLGRLDGVRFAPDVARAAAPSAVLAFVSRWGALTVDGAPRALAALAARERRVPERTQEQLLAHAAALVLGPEAGPRELVAWIFEDLVAAAAALRAGLGPAAQPFASPAWTRFPG